MNYAETNAGRVEAEASAGGRVAEQAVFWTYERVLERLVETVCCWRRMPGGGRWPFASDGPWHLIREEDREHYGSAENISPAAPEHRPDRPPPKPLPLRRAEIAAMQEATEWITWVPEDKRIALVFGLGKLASGASRIPWRRLSRRLGTVGPGGLEWRFDSGIEMIAMVLNAMAGVRYVSRKGAAAAYPRAVREIVERLKAAENSAGNVSRPVIRR